MSSFKDFYLNILSEKLITFGGKAYPKNGNVVIVCGGSGSGKGFVIKNLLGIQGKVLDVDRLKEFALSSKVLQSKYPELKNASLKDPMTTHNIHHIIATKEKLDVKMVDTLKRSIKTSTTELPNLIFDITLKDFARLKEISNEVQELGYNLKNIHLVWVLTDIDSAIQQNQSRSRTVPNDILMRAHVGVANSMKQIIQGSQSIKNLLDGDIWVSFNKPNEDVSMKSKEKNKGKGNYVTKANYIKIKSQGNFLDPTAINPDVIKKIQTYVPNGQF